MKQQERFEALFEGINGGRDENYTKANAEDCDQLRFDVYMDVHEALWRIVQDELMPRLNEGRLDGQVLNKLVVRVNGIKKSAQKEYLLNLIDRIRGDLNEVVVGAGQNADKPMVKPRIGSVNGRSGVVDRDLLSKQKALNGKVIDIFANAQGLMKAVDEVMIILNDEENNNILDGVILSTILNRFGKLLKRNMRILQNKRSFLVIERLMKILTVKIRESRDEFDAQSIGNGLYGLQGMGNSEGVEELLKVLVVKIRESRYELDGQAIGNALYGLQEMENSEGVEELLKALAVKIREILSTNLA